MSEIYLSFTCMIPKYSVQRGQRVSFAAYVQLLVPNMSELDFSNNLID